MSDDKKYPRKLLDPAYDLDRYGRELISALLTEFMRIVKVEENEHGEDFAIKLLEDYLASLISTMTYNALMSGESMPTSVEQYNISSERFLMMKDLITNAVGQGMTHACNEFAPDAALIYDCKLTCLEVSPGPKTLQ